MNFSGFIAAFIAVITIGLGFAGGIRLEYWFGAHLAKWVAVLGRASCALPLFLPGVWAPAITGIFGGTVVCGATELPEQAQRVARGLFPKNPNKSGPQP